MIRQASFTLPGGPSGVLLVHGLTGTPSEMRPLAVGLARAGYTVHVPQLAGHCGTEGDLLATRWQDWVDSVRDGYATLAGQVQDISMAGLSVGALMALALAASRPARLRALALLGPCFWYDGFAMPPHTRLMPLLRVLLPLGIGRRRRFTECHPFGVKDDRLRATLSHAMAGPDSSLAGLPGTPWLTALEGMRMTTRVLRLLPEITTPTLVLHAAEDDVADCRTNVAAVRRRLGGPVRTFLLDDCHHMITIDRASRKRVVQLTADFFRENAADHAPSQAMAAA